MKKVRVRKQRLLLIIIFIFLLILGVYSVLNSSLFSLKEVVISCESKVIENEVLEDLDINTGKNIFKYDLNKIQKEVLQNPYIEEVNVNLKLPNKISININQKEILGAIKIEEEYAYIDREGEIIEKTNDINEGNDTIVIEINKVKEEDNYIVFQSDKIKQDILFLIDKLEEDGMHRKVEKINYTEDNLINITTVDGTEVKLRKDEELEYNISRMSEILIDLQNKGKKEGVIDLTNGSVATFRP